MTWLRLDDDYASDGTIRRCRAVAWWPLILCAMKRGGGVASDDDVAPDVLADIGQGDEDAARQAVERLKAAGRIVAVAGGWSTPDWHDVQRETSSTERVRRHREKLKRAETDVTVSSCFMERDETVKRHTVHNSTEQNVTDMGVGVADASRARVEPSPVPMMPIPTEESSSTGIADVSEAFRRTQSGRQSMMLAPATVAILAEMVKAHSAPIVIEAIRRASERIQGDLTIAYLRPVVASVAAGEPERRSKQGEPGKYQPAAYKSANGVATPRRVPDGEL